MSALLEIIEMSMMNDINKLTVSSNNIANTTTDSFKREKVSGVPFDYYFSAENNNEIPSMTVVKKNSNIQYLDLSQGGIKPTNNPLDVAIEGEGFFVVQLEGTVSYTRKGNFTLDEQGRLITKHGHIVEGEAGEIRITTNQPKITKDGEIWDGDNNIGKIALVNIDTNELSEIQKDQYGYIRGDGLTTYDLDNVKILQSHIETSNVKGSDEMINTIETLRHFELNQKLIHMQQEMFKSSIDALGSF